MMSQSADDAFVANCCIDEHLGWEDAFVILHEIDPTTTRDYVKGIWRRVVIKKETAQPFRG